MTHKKSDIRKAAGKLTLAIQKEWGKEAGCDTASESEEIMNISHEFLKADTPGQLKLILGGKSVSEYLGTEWIDAHPAVKPNIEALERLI